MTSSEPKERGTVPARRFARKALWGIASAKFGAWGGMRRLLHGRRRQPDLSAVRSILVIRLDLLGDLLFTMPAIRSLRKAAPGGLLTALVTPYTADLLQGSDLADQVITVDVNRWRAPSAWARGTAPGQLMRVLGELRGREYDLCVVFYGRVAAAFALLSGARYLVGYCNEGYAGTFDLALPGTRYQERRHEAEYCLDLVRALGAPVSLDLPEPPVDGSAAGRVDRLLADSGTDPARQLVALHPGALNMAAKRWPSERWARVADRMQRELGCRVVLIGSASELSLVEGIRLRMETAVLALVGRTSIAELRELLRRCDLFLGGDSGPLHLASALGVPSVSVYGPTDPALTGPLGPRVRVLSGSAECIPCYDLSSAPICRRGDVLCMRQVSEEEVFDAARRSLASNRSSFRSGS